MAGINRTTGKATDLITFSRASGGTALRKISYGSELVTNGTFDTDVSGWSAEGSNTIAQVDGELEITLNSAVFTGAQTTYSTPTEVGKVYKLTATGRRGTSASSFIVRLGGPATNQISFTSTSNETKEAYYVATSSVAELRILTSASSGTGTVYVDNISVKEVLFDQPDGTLTLFNHPAGIPRIEYDASGAVKGLLIEEQRTNLVTYSEAFDNAAWTKNDLTVLPNAITAPDGSLSASKVTEGTGATEHQLYDIITLTSGVTYSQSVFAKKAERSFLIFRTNVNGIGWVDTTYDLNSGSLGTVGSGHTASITDVGNGWYKCDLTFVNGSSFGMKVNIGLSDDTISYTGDGISGIYIWGAQLEQGSFPTSYIPTSGATATRAADVASISVDSFGYNQSEGTLLVEMEYAGVFSTNFSNCFIVSGTATQLLMYNPKEIRIWDGSGGGANAGANHLANTPYKAISTWGNGSMGVSTDGSTPVFDTEYDGSFASVTDLNIFVTNTLAAGGITGHIKSIAYYPRRLTNDQLVELTT